MMMMLIMRMIFDDHVVDTNHTEDVDHDVLDDTDDDADGVVVHKVIIL
jgi:hypothetical protein